MKPRTRLLVAAGVLVAIVAATIVLRDVGSNGPSVPATSAPPTSAPPTSVAAPPQLTLDEGKGRISVYVDAVERQGELRVVRYEVENIGRQPVQTSSLRAEVTDDQGHRFEQRPGTAADLPGTLNPGEAGVITARFKLSPGAEPATLYVTEADEGEPIPVAIPR
jgi:hypothetical protein